MNSYDQSINELTEAALVERKKAKEHIRSVILERCEFKDFGRLQPGALTTYVFNKIGGKGKAPWFFQKFMDEVIVDMGLRVVMQNGKRVVKQLQWKNESCYCNESNSFFCHCWKQPLAQDIPKFNKENRHFMYFLDDGTKTYDIPNNG